MNGNCLWVRSSLGSMGIYMGFALVSPIWLPCLWCMPFDWWILCMQHDHVRSVFPVTAMLSLAMATIISSFSFVRCHMNTERSILDCMNLSFGMCHTVRYTNLNQIALTHIGIWGFLGPFLFVQVWGILAVESCKSEFFLWVWHSGRCFSHQCGVFLGGMSKNCLLTQFLTV